VGVRKGITVEVSAADRTRLKAIVSDENSPQKTCLASSVRIVLLTADGIRDLFAELELKQCRLSIPSSS
jgi:hypothetical protein